MNELIEELIEKIKSAVVEELRVEYFEKLNIHEEIYSNEDAHESQLLSYDEISREYKVSVTSLKKWKKNGLLYPDLKGGRTLLFRRKNVENCLLNRPRKKPSFIR